MRISELKAPGRRLRRSSESFQGALTMPESVVLVLRRKERPELACRVSTGQWHGPSDRNRVSMCELPRVLQRILGRLMFASGNSPLRLRPRVIQHVDAVASRLEGDDSLRLPSTSAQCQLRGMRREQEERAEGMTRDPP